MLDRTHQCFPPPSTNGTLWRYMDLTKLLCLLEDRALFFSRADQFEDPYEGSLSRAGVELLRDPARNGGVPRDLVETFISSSDAFRREMFISCWVASQHESAAMWKLYLQSSEGIAVKTDFESLATQLHACPLRVRATCVTYVDYDATPVPMDNLFFPFTHKRLSFSHENELRAIVWRAEDVNIAQIREAADHVLVPIAPEHLIHAIHISPSAPRWFGGLVERVLERYSLKVPIVRSSLYDRQAY